MISKSCACMDSASQPVVALDCIHSGRHTRMPPVRWPRRLASVARPSGSSWPQKSGERKNEGQLFILLEFAAHALTLTHTHTHGRIFPSGRQIRPGAELAGQSGRPGALGARLSARQAPEWRQFWPTALPKVPNETENFIFHCLCALVTTGRIHPSISLEITPLWRRRQFTLWQADESAPI